MPVEYQRLVTVVGNTPIGGRVVLVEGFEDGMTWLANGTGDTWVVDRTTSRSFEGAFSLELQTREVGATAGDVVYAGRYVHLGSSRKLIFDARFSFDAEYIDSTLTQVIDTIRFQIAWDDVDSNAVWAAIFDYSPPEGTWSLWHSGGLLSLSELHALKETAWHRIRAEINFEDHKYSWLQVDDVPVQQIDLSQYTLYSFSSSGTEYAYVVFFVYSELDDYRATCYFDDVLLLED